jgi:hypothetical protein
MKKILLVLLAAGYLSGCTASMLRETAVQQGESFTDVEYGMVLDNIAMFRVKPHSIPWFLKITGGTVQIDDSLSPSFSYTWPPASQTLSLGGSRGVTVNWNVVPIVSEGTLKAMTEHYTAIVSRTSFQDDYGVGAAPEGVPVGHYGDVTIWPRDMARFHDDVIDILHDASTAPEGSAAERGAVPGVVLSPHH